MGDLYYIISLFIFGLIFGSFFNVIGYRLPLEQSIVYPPSHCPKCNKRLTVWELIPVVSYIIQLGKCRGCKQYISIKYPIFELLTGILFAFSYVVFELSFDLVISLTFISALIIIMISDFNSMTIPDEIIIISSIAIIIELIMVERFNVVLLSIGHGLLAVLFMLFIKMMGDFFFKKESLGGGDIKLMFLIGILLGVELSIFVVMLAAFIALPIAILVLIYKKTNVISFGPYLGLAAIIIYLFEINVYAIYSFFLSGK